MIETDVTKQESLPTEDVGSRFVVYPSEDTLRDLGQFLRERFKKLKQLRDQSNWDKDKAEALRAYRMQQEAKPLPFAGAANFPCPLPRIGVDSFHSNVMSSLYTDGNMMVIKPVIIQKDYASKAQKAAQYMTFVMNHEAESYLVLDDADRKAQIYGKGYLEPRYVKEEIWESVEVTKKEMVPQVDPLTGEVTIQEKETKKREKKKKTVFDGTKVDSLPIESIYISPFVTSIEQAVKDDVVFKTFETSVYNIKQKSKARDGKKPFYIKAQVEKLEPSWNSKIYKRLSPIEMERAKMDGFYMDILSKDENALMAEAHLWWDIDGDDIKEKITATLEPETGVVIRVTLSKCRIVDITPRPLDGRFDGEGIPKMCEMISDEWETFHNTRGNAGLWENMPFFFYRAGGRFNASTITIKPGHGYGVDDPREVSFPQTQRVGMSYFQEEQLILSYFERIFALDENMQGVSASRRRTATESINVANRASIRFGNPFNRIVTSINTLLNHIWELNLECAPEEKEFYVVGEDGSPMFDKMQKYEYNANMKFSVAVESVFDQQQVRDSALLTYRLFIMNPIAMQHPEVIYALSQKTLDVLKMDISLPKPPEAQTLSPFEEHDLFQRGDDAEPQVGEDYDHHYKIHMAQLNSESIKEWDMEAVKKLMLHIDKTKILKMTLESANLNKSGVFPGMPGGGMGGPPQKQPAVTANRNPTQRFNTTKVGETSNSAKENLKNGMANGQNQDPMAQIFGSGI